MPTSIVSSGRTLLAALGAMLVGFVSGCALLSATTEPPRLSIVSIEPVEVTPLEQTYRLRVRLQNPNDHALDITGMSYVVEVNGKALLEGVSDKAVNLPRYGEAVIELTGVSTLFGFVRQIQALQADSSGNISYRLSGKLSLDKRLGRLPFSYAGTLLPPAASGKNN